jgi:peptidoglycan/LPS O-acetylase OafA/YrhL
MSSSQFALASAYRAVFTVAGGYVVAELAPYNPWRHAWALAIVGLLAGLAGVVAFFVANPGELGPAWYAISIPAEAIPCVLFGAWLSSLRNSASALGAR